MNQAWSLYDQMSENEYPDQTVAAPAKQATYVVVRFAGDSGDGIQIMGDLFTSSTATHGNDLATQPDFPAEIRAPAGTLFGVSGFQIQFGAEEVFTPGDAPDVLFAMNPAALRANVADLRDGGLLVVNTGAFTKANLDKAGYATSPIEDGSLQKYETLAVDIGRLTNSAVKATSIGAKDASRCKNFWALGLAYWLYDRPLNRTLNWIESRYGARPEIVQANTLALRAGYAYGEASELFHYRYHVPAARLSPGHYRSINGNMALAWGLLTAANRAERGLVLGSYPITPASDLLHELSKHSALGVTTVQAEDEIAAVCVAIGASYSGNIGVTATSGPGLALKTEAIGLAVALELPLVVIDVQRAGPSTGMPTKTEQADLMQAVYGRPGEAPVVVVAPSTPAQCFDMAIEAVRLATKYMTPVILLSDATLATGAEPWRIPELSNLPDLRLEQRLPPSDEYLPFARNPSTLARAWVVPGQRGYEYRIGGLEKDAQTGHVSYDPRNHERMIQLRARKVEQISQDIPEARLSYGNARGRLLVIGWGSSYGPIHEATRQMVAKGHSVSQLHLTHLFPFPRNLGQLLSAFDKVLVVEANLGQLVQLLRARFTRPFHTLNKVQGKAFKASEIERRIESLLEATSTKAVPLDAN